MLDFLFRRLTAEPKRGAALFETATRIAREPHWYVEGKVPDTIDGRFAVLATVASLVLVRLEAEEEAGNLASVALTERFIAVMESEHRELGMGDPTLGKTVRRLVGSLARRTELWRCAAANDCGWAEAARKSLYKTGVASDALEHSATELKHLWTKLRHVELAELVKGKLE